MDPAAYLPASQRVHTDAAGSEYRPKGHVTQMVAPAAPACVPAKHAEQGFPLKDAAVPGGQAVHTDCPGSEEDPGAHRAHTDAPAAAAYLP
jgi:hypothetical protein